MLISLTNIAKKVIRCWIHDFQEMGKTLWSSWHQVKDVQDYIRVVNRSNLPRQRERWELKCLKRRYEHFLMLTLYGKNLRKSWKLWVMQKNVQIPTRGSNTDLQPTNTNIEMDCAPGVPLNRSGEYINGSVRALMCEEYWDTYVCKIDVKCYIAC